MPTHSSEMRTRLTRDELLRLLEQFTSGELPVELFAIKFDELGKLGISGTLRDVERELFGELWRYYVDVYTPHNKKPEGIRGRLRVLGQQFKGESETGADAVRKKATELQRVMSSA